MNLSAYPHLQERLQNEEYRHAFTSASIRRWIAMQIRSLRKRRGWSQAELGVAAGKPQNVISRLEDPSYGKVSVQTLLDIAAAFDVSLILRFAPFAALGAQVSDMSTTAMDVPNFANELEEAKKRTYMREVPSQPMVRSSAQALGAPRQHQKKSSAEGAVVDSNRNSTARAQELGIVHSQQEPRHSALSNHYNS